MARRERSHSLTVCETPPDGKDNGKKQQPDVVHEGVDDSEEEDEEIERSLRYRGETHSRSLHRTR